MTTERPPALTRSSPPTVSVIVPMRNEAGHVATLVRDIAAQDYVGSLQVIVADGASEDDSVGRLRAAAREAGLDLTVVENPRRLVSPGLNACLAAARGDVIVRMDCHARYPHDYLRRCILALEETGAWNVGGRLVPVGRTPTERAVACAMASPFGGVGWTRHGSARAEVDTVFFGAFPSWVFDRVGLFDETLVRNQDADLNIRIRQAGGRIVLDPAIEIRYIPRGTYRALFRQYYEYGLWRGRVAAKHRQAPTARTLAPLALVSSLVALAALAPGVPLARRLLAWELGAYGLAAASFAVSAVIRRRESALLLPKVLAAFPAFHLAHGIGMGQAIVETLRRRWLRPPR
ncbi:MAG: glycosyltransferase family 2 protein [Thermoleophilia bacterium]